ncbi:MAG TPA: spore coat U domain-containing protein [Allosphingosinicella sp.]|nr:spore coat U domain-containing protein [Allosphingosinicella sp.]
MTGLHRIALLRSLLLAAPALLAGTLGAGPAEASVGGCSVSSAGITFSPYDTVNRPAVDSTGTISVTCTGSGDENLSLNLTGGNSGSCTSRQLRNGAASLGYQIYRDAARVSNFCDGGSRLDISIDFGSNSTQTRTYTMYGRIAGSQNPSWGSYSDTLAITLKKGGGTLATGSAPINGSVSPTCSVSAGTLAFGTYVSSAARLGTATVTVNCSNGAPYQVSLAAGQNPSGTTRRMAGPGGSYLSYQLYSNSGRTLAWGDGTALGARVNGTGSGGAQSRTVYGRIPAGQSANAGSYSDSVIVTVEY